MLSHTDCYIGAVDSRAVWGMDMDMPPSNTYDPPPPPNRKERRKSRIVKRRRGFPRGAWGGAWGGAWVYRITRGAGT